ncbi:hypothetical protein GCM10027446_26830 [Angustibacter peucedani]
MSQTLASSGARRTTSSAARGPATGRGAARPPRPSLRVVRAPSVDRGRTVFVVLCLLLLVGGLLSLLLINTALAQGSFTLHDLQNTSDELGDHEQSLRQDIAVQGAPARLAARATALGMVPSDTAAFLRLSDGKLLGVAHPAATPTTPTVKETAPPPSTTKSVQDKAKRGNGTKKQKATR